MRALRVACALMVLHAVAEFSGVLAPMLLGGRTTGFSPFAWEFLRDQSGPMALLGVVFGVLRLIAVLGIWRNRLWGLVLGLVMSVVTLVLMVFMLPSGVMDAVLTAPTVVLLLAGWLGNRPILPAS